MNPEQVADLAEHAHVYMTKDGRISMAGLNESNIQVSSNASHCAQCGFGICLTGRCVWGC